MSALASRTRVVVGLHPLLCLSQPSGAPGSDLMSPMGKGTLAT